MDNISYEKIIEVAKQFLNLNKGDESTENLIINLCCDILEISPDKFLEIL